MIERTALLACPPARAFELFTERAGDWWPADRRHTGDPHSTIRIEASGRFFERATDGREVELGAVRVFEPPYRLLLDWYPGTGIDAPTLVEVTFEPIETGTKVNVRHGPGDGQDAAYRRNRDRYGTSWDKVLAAAAGHAGTLANR